MLAGVKSDADLLKDLLADDYCHVCEAVLLFESQRLSHYEVCVCSLARKGFALSTGGVIDRVFRPHPG